MARRADQGLEARWQERIERREYSGMTVARFCAVEGVSQASFYQWRRKLVKQRRVTPEASPARPRFAAVRLVAATHIAAWLPGGTRVEIPLGDPAACLALETLVRTDAERAATERPSGHREGGAAC